MKTILIRRFARADKEKEFLAVYGVEKPLDNPAFHGETLTRVSDDTDLPEGLRNFDLNAPNCVTYLNIARWESWEAFAEHFATALADANGYDREIEVAPRQRIVLDEVPMLKA